MTCVCGHPHDAHVTVAMSVPMVGAGTESPYKIVGPIWNSIYQNHPTASYERDECHCGCCKFDKFEEDDV